MPTETTAGCPGLPADLLDMYLSLNDEERLEALKGVAALRVRGADK